MLLTIILLILIGGLSAILGSIVGIGGGIIIVPTLVYLGVNHHLLHGITTQIAIGTSSVILIVTGLSSSLGYLKTKQVDIKNGSIFLFGLLPGSLVGSFLSRYLTLDSFNLYFGVFMIFVSILLMIRHKIKPFKIFDKPKYARTYVDAEGKTYRYSVPPLFAFITTLFIGLLTGLFGIGGGALMTPLMLIVFRFPPHVAVGTSMMMIFLFKCDEFNRAHLSRTCGLGLFYHSHYFKCYRCTNRCEGQSIYEIRHSCNVIENSNAYYGYIFNH